MWGKEGKTYTVPFALLELASASDLSSGFTVSGKTNPFEVSAPCLTSVVVFELEDM